jgi:hypothetical protein
MNAPKAKSHELNEEQPSFAFFRTTPAEMMLHPPLASSLQSFETCLILIALERFPSALGACAAAIESAIKAKLNTPQEREIRLWQLIQDIRRISTNLRLFDQSKLDDFRETRNRVTHYGYTPKDDEVCAVQLLKTGLPFLEECYRELFSFELSSRPGAAQKRALESNLARQYSVCKEVYLRARQLKGISYRYCFSSLAHYIRLLIKQRTMPVAEANMLEIDAEAGVKYEHEEREKERFQKQLKGEVEEFDCPICDGKSTMLAQFDDGELLNKRISVRWCYCVSCGMLVREGEPYLADQLLRIPVEVRASMMKEFGIW